MRLNHCRGFQGVLALGLMAAGLSYADIVPTYESAGVQAPNVTAVCAGAVHCDVGMFSFDSWPTSPAPLNKQGYSDDFTTDFGTGGLIEGTYSGDLHTNSADAYGGADGSGLYAQTSQADGSYTLTLTTDTAGGVPGVNYFGMWVSAMDAGDLVQFYSGDTLVYTFTLADLIALIGACNGSNQYCGNPNYSDHTSNSNADDGKLFVYINFFDTGGYFDRIVFSEQPGDGGDFASDDHTVGYIDPIRVDSGTLIDPAPEPSSLGLFLAGGVLVALGAKRRHAGSRRLPTVGNPSQKRV